MKIVLVVLIMMNVGEAKDDLENIVMELNRRIALMEAKQMKTQEELKKTQPELHALKNKDIQLEERIRINEDDISATKDDLGATKDGLACTKEGLKMNDHALERDISLLKNPPFFHACGYQYYTTITGQTISYLSYLPLKSEAVRTNTVPDTLTHCRSEL